MINSLEDLTKKGSKDQKVKKLAVAAAEDLYVLQAVERISKLGLIAPIFIGDKQKIISIIEQENLIFSDYSVINSSTHEESAATTIELVKSDDAEMIMKGLLSTRIFIKAIVNKTNGIVGNKTLSHLALFESPMYHKLFGLTDAAMNISPDAELKSNIIKNAVIAFQKLGVELPKVAILAAIGKINPKMKATTDAAELIDLHKKSKLCNCILEGPLALDVAISKSAAAHKGIESQVAGEPDILILPEITSANILYKSLTFLGGAKTAGVLLGADVPIILTSRADSTESKYYSIALAYQLCNSNT